MKKQKLQTDTTEIQRVTRNYYNNYASVKQTPLVAQMVKHLPPMWEAWV